MTASASQLKEILNAAFTKLEEEDALENQA